MYFELHVQKLCFCNQFGVILLFFFFLNFPGSSFLVMVAVLLATQQIMKWIANHKTGIPLIKQVFCSI